MDIVTQNEDSVHRELLADREKTVEFSSGIVAQFQQKVQCGVLTDNGQTVEDSIGNSDTEPRDGTV